MVWWCMEGLSVCDGLEEIVLVVGLNIFFWGGPVFSHS